MEQEVDLIQYLPGFLQEIREFRELSKAENPEFKRLYEDIDALLNNGFIRTADLQGVKRWEKLLRITALTSSIEGRKAALLGKWNRTIPYTMTRLYEYLDALTARKNYHISFPEEYRMELVAEDLSWDTLRTMRELIGAMLPANMLFVMTDRVVCVASVPWDLQAQMRMTGAFYPRDNIPLFYLDGTAGLDGEYYLDGFLSGESLDFYPVALQIIAGANWRTERAGTAVAKLLFRPEISLEIKNDTALRIWGAAYAKAQTISRFFLQGSTNIGTQTSSRLTMQGAVEERVDTEASAQIIGDAKMKIAPESALKMESFADCEIKTDGILTVEKDLWQLDGSVMLDGSRILDAEIYEEEI